MNAALATRWIAPSLHSRDAAATVDAEEPVVAMPDAAEVQAVIDAARDEGFSAGYKEGLAGGQADIRRTMAQIEGVLDSFTQPLARLDNEVMDALAGLAMRIAGALVGREIQADPTLLATLSRQALEAIGSDARNVALHLHPDDLNTIGPQLELPEHVRMVADAQLARGDLRVHSESLRIDAGLEARLKAALAHVLHGDA